ncbi:MAG: COX15/CtaA family protein, partial [bacterium]
MPTVRRYSYIAFAVACAHLVFGAIVRISGSGMGCGDHWPRCYGSFFPPLNRPDLIIEVSHRYLASVLLLSLIALLVAAWRRRGEEGVGGPGGVLRSSALAVTLGVAAALLGAMTVKLGNAPFATLAHWTVAMSLVATVVATVIRAGGLGGATARLGHVSGRTKRATMAGAAVALITVVMGGLTAKYPGASVACLEFPLCGTNPDVQRAAVHVQLTHRVLAVLLVLHVFGLVMAQRKRRESPMILRAAIIAVSLGVLQLLVAGAMIGMHLPPVLRSLHEATGVSIWIATFVLAYLARISGNAHGMREPATVPPPIDFAGSGVVRASASGRHAFSTALADPPRKGAIERKEPWQSVVLS